MIILVETYSVRWGGTNWNVPISLKPTTSILFLPENLMVPARLIKL